VPIGYNITHDNGAVAMAYASGPELYPDPPAYRVGIDVMRLQLPRRITYAAFVESVSDQVNRSSCSAV
jgi:4'-phosphopantetheinyl transferase